MLEPASSEVEIRARGLRDLMLYAVAGTVYCAPYPYRICRLRVPWKRLRHCFLGTQSLFFDASSLST